jgi:hydroxymethylbilane synthase
VSAGALRVGTRGSPLALRQAALVVERLRRLLAPRAVEVVPIRTSGDRLARVALGELGGKGLFVRELEEALLDGRVDLAVHSLKDMPVESPPGLLLGAFLPREDPRDVLVSRAGGGIGELPPGARVGTGSLRRRALLLARRPDLAIVPVRGNVDTRLGKLEAGEWEALLLAAAGLARLGIRPAGARVLDVTEFLPAAGQGILAVEARAADGGLLPLLDGLDDGPTRAAALAERAFLRTLGADCHTPVAAHARAAEGELELRGLVGTPDGSRIVEGVVAGAASDAPALGRKLAEDLLGRGARELLGASGRSGG